MSIAKEWVQKLPPLSPDELDLLTKLAASGTVTANSRLASQASFKCLVSRCRSLRAFGSCCLLFQLLDSTSP